MEENQFSFSVQNDNYKDKGHYNRKDVSELNIIIQIEWSKDKTLSEV